MFKGKIASSSDLSVQGLSHTPRVTLLKYLTDIYILTSRFWYVLTHFYLHFYPNFEYNISVQRYIPSGLVYKWRRRRRWSLYICSNNKKMYLSVKVLSNKEMFFRRVRVLSYVGSKCCFSITEWYHLFQINKTCQFIWLLLEILVR